MAANQEGYAVLVAVHSSFACSLISQTIRIKQHSPKHPGSDTEQPARSSVKSQRIQLNVPTSFAKQEHLRLSSMLINVSKTVQASR